MIPFDFEYIRPESIEEALGVYALMRENGLNPIYYAGGTEIVTFCRTHKIHPGAVIDLKHIPECLELSEHKHELVCGAALSLNTIIEWNAFPLLSQIAKAIGDHSVRNRLTLGGNIAGRLPYRESVLSFLLTEATAHIAGPKGEREVLFKEIFHNRLLLEDEEFLIQLRIPKNLSSAPTYCRRKTKNSRIDYPIASVAFIKDGQWIRMAIGGVFHFPVRNLEAETILNDLHLPPSERSAKVVEAIPLNIANDQRASADYRKMLLEQMITEAIEIL